MQDGQNHEEESTRGSTFLIKAFSLAASVDQLSPLFHAHRLPHHPTGAVGFSGGEPFGDPN